MSLSQPVSPLRSARQTGLQWEQPVEAGPFSYGGRARPRDAQNTLRLAHTRARTQRPGELFALRHSNGALAFILRQPAVKKKENGRLAAQEVMLFSWRHI